VTTKAIKIYDDYIEHLNQQKSQRYVGKEEWFHSSSAGLCARKHYYSAIDKHPQSDKDADTMRLFRLGDVIHADIQDAVEWYAKENGARIFIEKELYIKELNVRGFIDLVLVDDGELIDIKSCNDFKWKTIFGKKYYDPKSVNNYMLQTATYAYWYNGYAHSNDLPTVDKMKLLFYNKNTSKMQELEVPNHKIEEAFMYWNRVLDTTKAGLPDIELGFAPAMKWECNVKYCSYYDVCGGGINGKG
jgi:hypothetical protein